MKAGVTVLGVKWSPGLIEAISLLVQIKPEGKLNSANNRVGKRFLKIMAKVDTSPLLALSNKIQNVT